MFELDSELLELAGSTSEEISNIGQCSDELYFNRDKDLEFFKDEMMMSFVQLSYRWGNIKFDSYKIIKALWYSGEITFFRESRYDQKNKYSNEPEMGCVKLPVKYMKNVLKTASAKVLISQILYIEKKYACLKQSALHEMNGEYTHESHIMYKNIARLKIERSLHEDTKAYMKEGGNNYHIYSLSHEFEKQRDEAQKSLEACEIQLATANTRIAELESQLAARRESFSSCNGKGLIAVVCRMRREGHTEAEIAAHLYDNGKWCSQAQVGALLYQEVNRIDSKSLNKRTRRLLGKP